MLNDLKFSVLMSIYVNENPAYFRESLESILSQTTLPSEIVLVEDGPLTTELNKIVVEYVNKFNEMGVSFKVSQLKTNQGLGVALNYGLSNCHNELIARMDTDDLCRSDRFEKQLIFMSKNADISVVGSDVIEFSDKPEDIYYKAMPQDNILHFSKLRNPLCHPSVMFRKNDIIHVGNYQTCEKFEDYYLWIRVLKAGYKIANISYPLVYMRATSAQYSRRRGVSYVHNTLTFAKAAHHIQYFGVYTEFRFIGSRIITSCIPKVILEYIYKKKLRKNLSMINHAWKPNL